ncbi:nuclear transport factor 2 family protein [Sinorhizobium fredii]|uniref:nuclear transport factor 2 family protein n=1 Tax=Rhizobium fredii TaxID=380 RepID=UPI00351578F2
MDTMDEILRGFFKRYESMANRVLASDMGVDETTFAFASDFIAASPAGVMAGKNDKSLTTSMEKGYARYRAIGTRELKIRNLEITPIDALHFLVRVDWRSVYEVDERPDIVIDFEVHYLVQLHNGEPRIFGWVSGDEEAVLREHGIG